MDIVVFNKNPHEVVLNGTFTIPPCVNQLISVTDDDAVRAALIEELAGLGVDLVPTETESTPEVVDVEDPAVAQAAFRAAEEEQRKATEELQRLNDEAEAARLEAQNAEAEAERLRLEAEKTKSTETEGEATKASTPTSKKSK